MHYFMSHNLFTLLQHSFFFICVMQRNFLFKSVWQCPLSLSVASSLQGERWVLGTPRRKRLLLHFAHSSGTFIFAFFCMSWHIRRGWRPERKEEVCGTLSLSLASSWSPWKATFSFLFFPLHPSLPQLDKSTFAYTYTACRVFFILLVSIGKHRNHVQENTFLTRIDST